MLEPVQTVHFTDSEGNTLVGVLVAPAGSTQSPCTILCHGFPSSKEASSLIAIQQQLAVQKRASLRFDFYGCGESEGDPGEMTVTRAVQGITAARRFLIDQGFQSLGILGSSFGGFAAIIAAGMYPDLAYLALKSPVCDYLGLEYEMRGKQGIRQWEIAGVTNYEGVMLKSSFLHDIQTYDSTALARRVSQPTLIVHGDADTDVPLAQSIKFLRSVPQATLHTIPHAGHQYEDPEQKEAMIQTLVHWIVSQV